MIFPVPDSSGEAHPGNAYKPDFKTFETQNKKSLPMKHMKPLFQTHANYKGVSYEVTINGDDIHLEGMHHDICIIRGYIDLLKESEDYCKQNCFDEYGRYLGFSKDTIEDIANEHLVEFAEAHASEGITLNHICN